MPKSHHYLLGLALGLASLAQAEEPTLPDPQSFGAMEGILNKCAELDPAHASQYRDRVKLVTQGASDKVVNDIRKSDAYQQAYDSTVKSIAEVAGQDAVKACKGSLAPGQ